MSRAIGLLALLSLGLLTACGPAVVYEHTEPIGEGAWYYADSINFDFTIPDTLRTYDLRLSVEHDRTFPYQNFYVNIRTGFPSGKRTAQSVSLQLAGDFGAWLGNCGGESCKLEIPVLSGARFDQVGDFNIVVAQHTRDEPLEGIRALGLRVTVAEEQ